MSSGPSGGNDASSTTTFTTNASSFSTTTTSPAPAEEVVTSELLLAIIVPSALVVLICAIACYRYFQNNDDEVSRDRELMNSSKHQQYSNGNQPADAFIGLDASLNNHQQHISRLGPRVESGSINSNHDNNKNSYYDNDNAEDQEDDEEGDYDDDEEGYYDEENYDPSCEEYNYHQNQQPGGKHAAVASSSSLNGNKITSPKQNHVSPPRRSPQKKNTTSTSIRTNSDRWKGVKSYNRQSRLNSEDSMTSTTTTDTSSSSNYDSDTSASKLPPAPGEAQFINPFGRASVHNRQSTISPQKKNNMNSSSTTSPQSTFLNHKSSVSPSSSSLRRPPISSNNNNKNIRSSSGGRKSGSGGGATLAELGVSDL